jgi:cytochrome c biogenesis protein CcmG/thiol:disulfide interchange protein DsbE
MGRLAFSLGNVPRRIPSTLIEEAARPLSVVSLDGGDGGLLNSDLKYSLMLLIVFASWRSGCRVEHATFPKLAETAGFPIYMLNWKDSRTDEPRWPARNKTPCRRVDASERVGIDLGVTGVPEIFVIDRTGPIHFRFPGVFTDEVWHDDFEPLFSLLPSAQ